MDLGGGWRLTGQWVRGWWGSRGWRRRGSAAASSWKKSSLEAFLKDKLSKKDQQQQQHLSTLSQLCYSAWSDAGCLLSHPGRQYYSSFKQSLLSFFVPATQRHSAVNSISARGRIFQLKLWSIFNNCIFGKVFPKDPDNLNITTICLHWTHSLYSFHSFQIDWSRYFDFF